jgi:ATP synthase j chain
VSGTPQWYAEGVNGASACPQISRNKGFVVEMAFLGLRRWPVPVHIVPLTGLLCIMRVAYFQRCSMQIARPLWPFGVAAAITLWGVIKIQNTAVACT